MLLPQEHTVMVRQTSKWGQILLMSLVGFGATACATAYFYRLDEIVTVQGRLVPEKGGVEIKGPLTGQLEEIYIKNGEKVDKNQVLFRYEVRSAREQEKTLTKQIDIEEKRVTQELKSNAQRQQTLERNIELTTDIANRLNPLQRKGAISEIQLFQQLNNLESQKDEMTQLKTSRSKIVNDSLSRLTELKGKLGEIKNRLRNEYIKSPLKGTVFDLKPDNNSYVTSKSEILAKIIPKGNLSAEVILSNQDIGFIYKGQEVKVRVDSFPFTQYGEIEGFIKSIGADALPPTNIIKQYHFPVMLSLSRSNLETKQGEIIPLQAGLTISANVKLRDRRLIEIISDIFSSKADSIKRLRKS